jgi:hypothetical protein
LSITTAAELKTALAGWSHRSDLTARLDDFITLFESRINRSLRIRGMEASMTSTALTDGAIDNPDNFLAWKELRYDGLPTHTLSPKPIEWIRNQNDLADRPAYFAVSDTQTVCWPQSGSVKGTYYRSLPSLTSEASNWLLTSHPDLYLFGCLEELSLYVRDMEAVQVWGQKAAFLMDQLQSSDNANAINGGPLTARAR